jgi:hypothetical protein
MELQMHLRIRSGKELAGRVIDVHFHEQRARSEIDRIRRAHELPLKRLSRKFLKGEVRGEARLAPIANIAEARLRTRAACCMAAM